MNDIKLVIPTYRLREVADTVRSYSENFARYGHDIPIFVFDDSDMGTSRQYSGLLSATRNAGGVFYVGPGEKSKFREDLETRTKINPDLLCRMFKPSYGGNRNFTVTYSLGNMFITVDDDIRPFAILEECAGLDENQVCHGRYVDRRASEFVVESQDIVSAYLDFLGKDVGEIPSNIAVGGGIEDSAMDLLTNTTKDGLGENTLFLLPGSPAPDARIKVAQTYRTGTSDIDAKDYVAEFLKDPAAASTNETNMLYVISDIRPCVTETNWRIDSAVSAYDNRDGIPPFIPTKLRCEDYIFRLWARNPRVATAHVGATQSHYRSPCNRASLPGCYHNEELANYFKRELVRLCEDVGDTSLTFEDSIGFPTNEAEEMIEQANMLYGLAISSAREHRNQEGYFREFADGISCEFNGFDLDVFMRNTRETLSEEFYFLRQSMGAWQRILDETHRITKYARRMS